MANDTNALREQKEHIYQQLQELSKQIGAAIRELKERRNQRNELTKLAQEQKQVRKDLSKVIKDKIVQVKELRAKRGDKPKIESKESPGKLKMEIQKLEHKLETSAMDFTAEQKLTKIIKEKKVLLAKIGGDTDMDRHIRAMSKEIDKLKRESDVAHEKVTVAAKESQQHHEVILDLSKKIEAWKKEEMQLQEQYTKLKEEINAKADSLPQKKPRKAAAAPQNSAADEAVLKEKVAEVEQKVKEKKKLTTEDLLAFQAKK